MDEPTIRRASIFVADLRLEARVGVNPGEQGAEQPIVVDVWVGIEDMALAARSERLRDTMDYVGIARTVRKVVERRHYPLVETLVTAMAQAVLARPGATWVRVRLRKLDCLRNASGAGVEVELGLDDAESRPRSVALDQVADPEEVIVIGGGAAGFAACLWCWRLGHPALLIDPGPTLGGQLRLVHGLMTDLPAQNPMTGQVLARRLWRQFIQCRGRWLRGELRGVETEEDGCTLQIGGLDGHGQPWERRVRGQAAIFALGVRRRELGVPGESELVGKGVLTTAARDLEGLSGKRVVVVGGGDSALENALLLATASARVTVVHRGARLSAREQFVRAALQTPSITIQLETAVRRFLGEEQLTGVEVAAAGEQVLPAQAVLVRVGWLPNSARLPARWLDEAGCIRVDAAGQIVGERVCFAAGDILGRINPCVATAFGGGATAARAAVALLERRAT
jgi:thioredoxin reductase (NADPH)